MHALQIGSANYAFGVVGFIAILAFGVALGSRDKVDSAHLEGQGEVDYLHDPDWIDYASDPDWDFDEEKEEWFPVSRDWLPKQDGDWIHISKYNPGLLKFVQSEHASGKSVDAIAEQFGQSRDWVERILDHVDNGRHGA